MILALAHGTSPAAPVFNGLFFATAATVIPVLFLALAVQGHVVEDLIKPATEAIRNYWAPPESRKPIPEGIRGAWVGSISLLLAQIVIFAGGGGEILSFIALYLQKTNDIITVYVLAGVIALIVAASVGPTLALMRSTREMLQMGPAPAAPTPAAHQEGTTETTTVSPPATPTPVSAAAQEETPRPVNPAKRAQTSKKKNVSRRRR